MEGTEQYNDATFMVSELDRKETKDGKPYYSMKLRGMVVDQEIKGNVWSDSFGNIDQRCFFVGAIVQIHESAYNSTYNNYNIKNMMLVKEACNGLTNDQLLGLFNIISRLLGSSMWNTFDYSLKVQSYLIELFNSDSTSFMVYPAARSKHHAYRGGLILHTLELLYYFTANSEYYMHAWSNPKIRIIDCIAGILAHDFYKIKEYDYDDQVNIIKYNTKSAKSYNGGHIFLGASFAYGYGLFNISNIIASHHGIVDHGAIVPPQTPEAHLVHILDLQSANTGFTTSDKLSNLKNIPLEEKILGLENLFR